MTATLDRLTRFLHKRAVSRLTVRTPLRADQRQGLEKYCPHKPWPKQQLFLSLDDEEVFYGGSAGPGKTDALLMAALQYVHVPGYSALILRRDTQRLSLAGAIMDRAKAWLASSDAVWNEQRKTYRFPSGASIQFGYIDNPVDRFRYASAEYQFIAFEELTEFRLGDDDEHNPYLFMFSRLRKSTDINVPLRMRSASNPGNIGHAWVKRRFIPADFRGIKAGGTEVFDVGGRKFIPAQISDNPAINEVEYRAKLAHLPPVTRERLMHGDWQVAESLQIPEAWIRYYTYEANALIPLAKGKPAGIMVDDRTCRRFGTVDTAGTSRDKAEESRGKPPSWSVAGIWDYNREKDLLFLRNVWRDRVGWNELKLRVPELLRAWKVSKAKIENAHVGPPLKDECQGVQCELIGPMLPGMADGWRGAKMERAIAGGLLSRLEAGRLLVPDPERHPETTDWVREYVAELTGWSGLPDETADQIDMSSYATYDVKRSSSRWGGVATVSPSLVGT